jgi:HSP20 family protein
MAITRWQPMRATLRPYWMDNWSPLSRLMEDFFQESRNGDVMVWGPNVDVVETTEGFEIHAELPGVRQEDVKITLDNNVLTLSGEKKQETREDKDSVLRVERSYGRFERSFSLPATVKADGVRARYEDGVLRITLPKAEEAKARQIPIQ